jgi:hypothetical protein
MDTPPEQEPPLAIFEEIAPILGAREGPAPSTMGRYLVPDQHEQARRWTTNETLAQWFGYHAPSCKSIADAHDAIRAQSHQLARILNDLLPECSEKTRALNAIRDACMLGNAAIACHQQLAPGVRTVDYPQGWPTPTSLPATGGT